MIWILSATTLLLALLFYVSNPDLLTRLDLAARHLTELQSVVADLRRELSSAHPPRVSVNHSACPPQPPSQSLPTPATLTSGRPG